MHVRKVEAGDAPAIAAIILPVIREAATYTLDPDMSEADALTYWMGPEKETFVAEENGVVLGTYYMQPNQAGGGQHVCNCGYMTHATAAGRGLCGACASIRWGTPDRVVTARYNSTLWSARINALCGRGFSGERSA